MSASLKAITATLLLSATVPARAGFVGLGDPANAASYNEFILGNSTRTNVDSQGMVAVGGNAIFTNFTIDNLGHGSNALVVGGNLTGSSASIAGSIVVGGNAAYSNPTIHGGFSAGGNLTLSNWGTVTGPIVTGGTFTNATGPYASYGSSVSHGSVASPIDFSAEATALRSISTSLGGTAGTTVSPVYGTLTFTGGAGVDVFHVLASDLSKATGLVINAPSGATVIIDVDGTSASIQNAGFSLHGGIGADHVLYNFDGATSLSLSGVGVEGTILAPWASVAFNNGAVNGSLIALNLTGSGETHIFDGGSGPSTLFDGTLPLTSLNVTPVPEPASLALMAVGGVALVAFARQQRKAIRGRLD